MVAKLASKAGNLVQGTAPAARHPRVPHTVSRGMAKSALWEKLQRSWLRVLKAHEGTDHLSHVQPGVRRVNRLLVGDRLTQTTLARLRFGHSDLAAHCTNTDDSVSSMCICGVAEETTDHYLLHCRLFESQRQALFSHWSPCCHKTHALARTSC